MHQSVERLIIHQFDPARPSPGGIDTCLRGILGYVPSGITLAVIGVDTGSGAKERQLGKWETHKFRDNTIRFLPVVKLDPADQSRKIPHSVRLVSGLLRYRSRMPKSNFVQAHRMDTALAMLVFFRRPLVYMIHTQENGLTGRTSDSFWRSAGGLHRWLERRVVAAADRVFVFNEAYSKVVRGWNYVARFSPTWFDPAIVRTEKAARDPHKIVWVGRLETPKDPHLAIDAFSELSENDNKWTLDILGSGTLLDELNARKKELDPELSSRLTIRGRVSPDDVADIMSTAGVFLMTSHAGYEGYPRVLVEAMASGLLPVVTTGSDTGGLVRNGQTGFVTSREPGEIALRIAQVVGLERNASRTAVSELSAPAVVGKLFSDPR